MGTDWWVVWINLSINRRPDEWYGRFDNLNDGTYFPVQQYAGSQSQKNRVCRLYWGLLRIFRQEYAEIGGNITIFQRTRWMIWKGNNINDFLNSWYLDSNQIAGNFSEVSLLDPGCCSNLNFLSILICFVFDFLDASYLDIIQPFSLPYWNSPLLIVFFVGIPVHGPCYNLRGSID